MSKNEHTKYYSILKMKRKTIILLLLFCTPYFTQQTFAQHAQDSVFLKEYLPLTHVDALKWITRYQKELDEYQDANKKLQDTSCDVLFLGSSSINRWDNIYNDMAPLKIIRRSYGGAAIRDMLYYYDIIARGFHPRTIVLYVENDLNGSLEDLSIGDTYDFIRIFIARLQRDYPSVPIYMLSFKPSYARIQMLAKQKVINLLLQEYASQTSGVNYIDVSSCMYDEKGFLRKNIFKEDNLHMNQKGYDLWTTILKPILIKR